MNIKQISGMNPVFPAAPKKTQQQIIESHNSKRPSPAEIAEEEAKAAKFRPILDRLRAGQRLSSYEMDFLRREYPEVYTKARRVEFEITQLERAVRSANSREEAQQIVTKAGMAALSNARIGGNEPDSANVFLAAAIRRVAANINAIRQRED